MSRDTFVPYCRIKDLSQTSGTGFRLAAEGETVDRISGQKAEIYDGDAIDRGVYDFLFDG